MVSSENSYIPDRGQIIYINFNPTKGREQQGRRPAFVLSPRKYNAKSSLAVMMPITSHRKGYPFEVILPEELKTNGVILVDQVKSLDWRIRQAEFVESVTQTLVREVQNKLKMLLL
ncbi:endoribonuclease MazF [Geitlerinema sp. CS-897]|nr:endoribonuclease MazF [Geitlerinema sp. CS-897]